MNHLFPDIPGPVVSAAQESKKFTGPVQPNENISTPVFSLTNSAHPCTQS